MRFYRFSLILLLLIFPACGKRTLDTPQPTATRPFVLKKQTIVLDAGHGGKDPGTTPKSDTDSEKELNLKTTHLVRDYLQNMGYEVVLTRNKDHFVELSERAHIANALKADLFISIHYNHSPKPEAKGIEVFYYRGKPGEGASPRLQKSRKLGEEVLSRVLWHTGAQSRGVKRANFAVIRETKMPAILIEGGFLSNPQERDKLKDPRYLHFLAYGIAKGVDEYLSR